MLKGLTSENFIFDLNAVEHADSESANISFFKSLKFVFESRI